MDLTGKLDATDRDNQLLYLTWGPTITHMDGNKNNTPPTIRVPMPGADERLAELDAEIAKVNQRVAAVVNKLKYVDPASLKPLPKPKL